MSKFTHHNEPYGTVVFAIESVTRCAMPERRFIGNSYLVSRAEKGWLNLTGTVIRGKERSRLFGSTSSRDLKGRPYTLAVSPAEFAKGFKRSIAM
mgnify:CR=1 FL=1